MNEPQGVSADAGTTFQCALLTHLHEGNVIFESGIEQACQARAGLLWAARRLSQSGRTGSLVSARGHLEGPRG